MQHNIHKPVTSLKYLSEQDRRAIVSMSLSVEMRNLSATFIRAVDRYFCALFGTFANGPQLPG
jgi:hypothetical protein